MLLCSTARVERSCITYANDSLCAGQGYASGTRWWWCHDVVGKCSSRGCLLLGSRQAWPTGIISSLMSQERVNYISDVAVNRWVTCTEIPSILFRPYFTFSCYSYVHPRVITIKEQSLHPSLEGRGNMIVLVAASMPVKDTCHCSWDGWFHFSSGA